MKPIADVCLRISKDAKMCVRAAACGESGSYAFLIWKSRNGEPRVELERREVELAPGSYRVHVYPDNPGAVDANWIAPTFIGASIELTFNTEGVAFSGGGSGNPWPPT